MAKFNRDKYLAIAKSQGVASAITQLHHELQQLEYQTFEGTEGYLPALWEEIKEIRNFSIELWNLHRSTVGAGGVDPIPMNAD